MKHPTLIEKVRETLRLKHYSYRTEQNYVYWTRRYWLIVSLLYGSGLRLTESLRLRVKDIDFHSNQIVIHDGKGKKDRITMLPEKLKASLIAHLTEVKKLHEHFLKKGVRSPLDK